MHHKPLPALIAIVLLHPHLSDESHILLGIHQVLLNEELFEVQRNLQQIRIAHAVDLVLQPSHRELQQVLGKRIHLWWEEAQVQVFVDARKRRLVGAHFEVELVMAAVIVFVPPEILP